jgi:hypothetical protein
MGALYTIKEIIEKLPTVEISGIVYALSGSSSKSISSGVKISYVSAGDKLVKVEKKIPRTISVSNAEFVVGDITTLPLGEEVEVEGIVGILRSISSKGFTVEEILTND